MGNEPAVQDAMEEERGIQTLWEIHKPKAPPPQAFTQKPPASIAAPFPSAMPPTNQTPQEKNLADRLARGRRSREQTQQLTDKAYNDARGGWIDGISNMYKNHGPNGEIDKNLSDNDATFDVNGQKMSASEYGNYVAGHAAAGYDQKYVPGLGYASMRLGGALHDFVDDTPTLFDDDGSIEFINQGYNDGKARSRALMEKPQAPTPSGRYQKPNNGYPKIAPTPKVGQTPVPSGRYQKPRYPTP